MFCLSPRHSLAPFLIPVRPPRSILSQPPLTFLTLLCLRCNHRGTIVSTILVAPSALLRTPGLASPSRPRRYPPHASFLSFVGRQSSAGNTWLASLGAETIDAGPLIISPRGFDTSVLSPEEILVDSRRSV